MASLRDLRLLSTRNYKEGQQQAIIHPRSVFLLARQIKAILILFQTVSDTQKHDEQAAEGLIFVSSPIIAVN